MYASATCAQTSREKSSVTFTLMPSAVSCSMAESPSVVAGTLIMTFGRSSVRHSRRASSTVPAVSCAR